MQNENDRKKRKAEEKAKKQLKFSGKKTDFKTTTEKKREVKEDVEIISTPLGSKKDVLRELPKAYCPSYTEEGWFSWWEKKGYFKPEYNESKNKGTFTIMIPPPNVTGVLHIGHALTLSIEDCVVRWQRMKGKQTLWLPGTDHAGIATQTVVEKKILRERKITRHDLGREKFIEEVWKWKNEKGDRIVEQLKKVGSSCDFSRLRFTMDDSMSTAVTEAFVRLFESGAIYRAKRLVNWSCALRSAISEIEVDKVEMKGRTGVNVPGYDRAIDFGQMVRFVYIVKDSGEKLIVATTRIETMLGDTAVAVHPLDERYTHLHSKFVIHPFRSGECLPIVLDEIVDPNFGTGVVKITPAHDATDFGVGQRHNLAMPTIFTDDGHIAPGYGEFSGMKRFDARIAIIERLKDQDLFVDIADHCNVLPICSKSKDVIEPMLKDQWYLRCQESALEALEAQKRGDLRLLPEGVHDNVWNHWLTDCHDWCISRQLWWGHRIPAYKVVSVKGEVILNNDTWIAARSKTEAIKAAATKFNVSIEDVLITQDEDVLDTWFSSQLFPFATLGWPNNTEDMAKYYPGDLLETGHDIIFFWVSRMVMIGLRMTEKLPFNTVYLHAMIRDAHGRKMSKSLGNVLDPLDVISGISLAELQKNLESGNLDPRELERAKSSQAKDFPDGIPECGTDALRFALLAYTTQPRDINLDVLRVKGYRNFCNKIWQAFKYCKMYGVTASSCFGVESLSATDMWILSRLAHTVTDVNVAFSDYNFAAATTAMHKFWIYEFCDVYIEYTKQFRSCSRHFTIETVLYECLDFGLRLLHPMMPFITEELYQRLPRRNVVTDEESICVASYPESEMFEHFKINVEEESMTEALDILKKIRVFRKDISLLDKQELEVTVAIHDQAFCDKFLNDIILPLSKSKSNGVSLATSQEVIVSHKNVNIHKFVPSIDSKLYEHFFHVRSSQINKDKVIRCVNKFQANDDDLQPLELIRVKQWFYWINKQILKGKGAMKDMFDLLERNLTLNTYVAETKKPSASDSWLLQYFEDNQISEKFLSKYPSITRWYGTVKHL